MLSNLQTNGPETLKRYPTPEDNLETTSKGRRVDYIL